jgi:hypothetical protein
MDRDQLSWDRQCRRAMAAMSRKDGEIVIFAEHAESQVLSSFPPNAHSFRHPIFSREFFFRDRRCGQPEDPP